VARGVARLTDQPKAAAVLGGHACGGKALLGKGREVLLEIFSPAV
jgi:hypothetical protein